MKRERNQDIRRELRALDIPFWRIAEQIGVSEQTVGRWLRIELDEKKTEIFKSAIEEIKREDGGGHDVQTAS